MKAYDIIERVLCEFEVIGARTLTDEILKKLLDADLIRDHAPEAIGGDVGLSLSDDELQQRFCMTMGATEREAADRLS